MSLFKKSISDALEDVKDKAGELKKKARTRPTNSRIRQSILA